MSINSLLNDILTLEEKVSKYETTLIYLRNNCLITCEQCNTYVDLKDYDEEARVCDKCSNENYWEEVHDEWNSDVNADIADSLGISRY